MGATITITVGAGLEGLVAGDYVLLNEVIGNAGPPALTGVNGVSGPIFNVTPTTFDIIAPADPTGSYASGGIVESLTRAFPGDGDGIRWYDGDPHLFLFLGMGKLCPSPYQWSGHQLQNYPVPGCC